MKAALGSVSAGGTGSPEFDVTQSGGGPWAFMELQDEYPLWKVLPQFAQLLLDHRDGLDDYRDELRRLAYWVVREDFD